VFTINPHSGEIKLSRPLDRETMSSYTITITARDSPSSGESKVSSMQGIVSITDINDENPSFGQYADTCKMFISDDTPFFSSAFTITATDADSGRNAELTYSAETESPSSDFNSLFTLDPITGVFTVTGDLSLDKSYPSGRDIPFKYKATDSGTPSLSTEIACSVFITGENKHMPVLSHPETVTVVTSSIYKTHQIFVVKATDADAGPDGTLSYTFKSGNEDSVFLISGSGVITIKTEPNKGYYALDVTISDNASPIKRKSTQCRVLVYFSSLPMTTNGDITMGGEIPPEEILLSKDEIIELPVFVQLGLHNLEGIDIELTVPADVGTIESVNTDYQVIRLSDNKVRMIGLTDPDKNTFGLHQFASLVLKGAASKTATVVVASKINGLVSEELKDISLSTTIDSNSCSDQWNIVADCEINIKDAAYIQTYVREQANGFSSSLGNKLSGSSTALMDTDQNGVINNQDASIMINSLLGNTLTLTSFIVQKPGDTKANDGKCALAIVAETRFNALDTSTVKAENFKVYLLVSHSSNDPLSKQLADSDVQITSSLSFSFSSGNMKNVFVIPMTSTSDGKFKLVSQSFALLETDVGLSLVIMNVNRPDNVSTTFQNVVTTDKAGTLPIDQSTVAINPQDEPQVKETFALTSHRCANPLETMKMRMKLEGDFDKYIANKQDEFKSGFKSYFEAHMSDKHEYDITISNIQLSKGSVVTEFDVQHEPTDADGIVDSVVDDLNNNQINVPFDGENYPAQQTLVVGDQERIIQPTSDEEDPLLKAYIAIAVIVALVLIMGIIICCYLSQKKEQHLAKEKDDFERKLSDPDFPSMASQSKPGVVNNAYEYFKTLDNSQCHSPDTKHVVNSLRKPPFSPLGEGGDEMVPPAQAPLNAHLEETRSSLRRRNTPKSLEEVQRELRVCSFYVCSSNIDLLLNPSPK